MRVSSSKVIKVSCKTSSDFDSGFVYKHTLSVSIATCLGEKELDNKGSVRKGGSKSGSSWNLGIYFFGTASESMTIVSVFVIKIAPKYGTSTVFQLSFLLSV